MGRRQAVGISSEVRERLRRLFSRYCRAVKVEAPLLLPDGTVSPEPVRVPDRVHGRCVVERELRTLCRTLFLREFRGRYGYRLKNAVCEFPEDLRVAHRTFLNAAVCLTQKLPRGRPESRAVRLVHEQQLVGGFQQVYLAMTAKVEAILNG